ncbi:XrtA-associated ATPase [Geomonas sp. Red32]|uniref:XrtA/PEP-CTERM system-associated ATPase n=1 Tax=Geomonas sp. Red32 TaxID=2912856 RepID=UPI00202CEB5E|nr:XrtA/PEP-CTERM system-associated ATPase [Geomonas sp. Red32]MCM0083357.1 XrtA-associated ATPase [Geomonas sp. Red32]
MYESFFNLKKKPFELVPDPDFIYLSRSHKKALTYLDYGIRERAGFILLTGEVGAGKTTIIRDLLNKKYDRLVTAKVFNTRADSIQLLAMINDDFGLPTAGKDRIALLRDLNDFLLEQYAAGKQPFLIIDEAQNLGADLLEEIRMLSNLESAHSKLLQIMLVGQPELRETLSGPGLMQLRQRISINCHLRALTPEETAEYVVHRMEVAGNAEALHFHKGVIEIIHYYSRGIPRLINIICDFIMLSAFAEEVREASVEMVREIIGDLDFENHYWNGIITTPIPAAAAPAGAPPATGPAGAAGSGAGTLPPGAGGSDLASRLASVEAEVSRVPSVLNELNELMGRLRAESIIRTPQPPGERKEAALPVPLKGGGEVHAKVEKAVSREAATVTPAPATGGLMRRLFGGAGSPWK